MEWTGARYADTPTVESRTWVDAPPERVWELVSDIELMPRVSSELQSVEWLDGLTGPAVGARFAGHNAHTEMGEWSTTSYVVRFEPPTVFAWAVENPDSPAAVWRFTCTAQDGGTLLTQWVQLGPGRSGLSEAIERMPDKEQKIVYVRLREFESGIHATVEAIKTMAEQGRE
ncbi:SRPBCC family protein [Allosaccharopolyspora coralli]|uniref:SRPBCC family protein n=1 Tax=Allosaccharopolyspora coralli TaxID=2665642 RepID=A0A5Q3Q763_9PSEU|nr:SRPBCC family protein [Allosaccharopolyspora coralli]QGK70458.1 SRPBCC family protein [Allosaccharopolyspora coralli]